MDGMSEHTAEKCPDCGNAPGERNTDDMGIFKECSDDGCDQIANPLLTSGETAGPKWMNPYGGIYSAETSKIGDSEFCGYLPSDKYAQGKLKYLQSADQSEACSNYDNEPKMSSAKGCSFPKRKSRNPVGYYPPEDEMMVEAKRWMSKYSDLKSKMENQMEFLIDYVDEAKESNDKKIEVMMDGLYKVINEKFSELEKKIESSK